MQKSHRTLAYTVMTVRSAQHGLRTVARFTCAVCAVTGDFTLPSPDSHAPDRVVNAMRDKGWQVDKNSRRLIRCPEHNKRRQHRKPGEQTMGSQTVPQAAPNGATFPPVAAPKPMTADDRARIRRKLEEYFDDKAGRYLDGMSDQKIGEQLGIAWANVKAVREAAYGELRSDPEIDALQRQLFEAMREHQNLVALVAKNGEAITLLQSRLNTVTAKLGLK